MSDYPQVVGLAIAGAGLYVAESAGLVGPQAAALMFVFWTTIVLFGLAGVL